MKLFIAVLPLLVAVGPVRALASGSFQGGGSDYIAYQLGVGDPSRLADYGYPNGNWRAVLATYHLDPTTVRGQLAQMCAGGQHKITLMAWFEPASWMSGGYLGELLDSTGGNFSSQVQTNITNLVTDISQSKAQNGSYCFNELGFRFARWGSAFSADPNQTESNWNVIASTRTLIENAVSAAGRVSTLYRLYDLDAEQGAAAGDQFCNPSASSGACNCADVDPNSAINSQYLSTIWQRYVALNPSLSDTYGFSEAPANNRTTRMFCLFDSANAYPGQYAFDVYSAGEPSFPQVLSDLKAALTARSLPSSPGIVIQETNYADAPLNHRLLRDVQTAGLNLRVLYQWNLSRCGQITAHTYAYFDPTQDPSSCGGCQTDADCASTRGATCQGGLCDGWKCDARGTLCNAIACQPFVTNQCPGRMTNTGVTVTPAPQTVTAMACASGTAQFAVTGPLVVDPDPKLRIIVSDAPAGMTATGVTDDSTDITYSGARAALRIVLGATPPGTYILTVSVVDGSWQWGNTLGSAPVTLVVLPCSVPPSGAPTTITSILLQ